MKRLSIFLYLLFFITHVSIFTGPDQFNVIVDCSYLRHESRTPNSGFHSTIRMHSIPRHYGSYDFGSSREPDLHRCSAEQFEAYFTYHCYTEKQILEERLLYMSDEFIKLAKTCAGYELALARLHRTLHKMWDISKPLHICNGDYCPGLKKRICYLYREMKRAKAEREAARHEACRRQKAYIQEISTIAHNLSHTEVCDRRYPADHYTKRIQALEAVQTGNDRYAPQWVTLDKKVCAFAQQYNIPETALTNVTMNRYERQLHNEFVEQLTSAMALAEVYEDAEQYRLFLDALGEGIALGIENNQLHKPQAATQWADYGWAVLEIAQGIAEGVALGAYNTAHFVGNSVSHPIKTAQDLAHGISTIARLLAKATYTANRWCGLAKRNDYATLSAEIHSLEEHIALIAHQCIEQLAVMSKREIAKYVTAFGTEWVLTGKVFAMAHGICTRLGPLAREVTQVLREEHALEHVVVTADGMLLSVPDEVKKLAGAAGTVVTDSKALLENMCKSLMTKLEPEITWLRTLFDLKKKGFAEFARKYLKIDYKHILGMKLYFNRRGVSKIGGFHHDFMGLVEKSGVFKFVKKVVYENGLYKASLLHNGRLVKKSATFFPSHWSREKVISKIYEAYDNFVNSGAKDWAKRGEKYVVEGSITEGVKIRMFITKKGLITSAYPILQ